MKCAHPNCRWPPGPDSRCDHHTDDPERQAAARAKQAEAGRKGQQAKKERDKRETDAMREALAQPVPLRTLEQIQAYVEAEAVRARVLANPRIASAAAQLAAAALKALPIAELKQENLELRQLLVELKPELRPHLKLAR